METTNNTVMKGISLNIKILTIVSLVSAIIMSVLGVYESWSKHHLTSLDPLYYTCMGSIFAVFLFASFGHRDANLLISRNFNNTYLRNLLRPTAYLFFLTFIFGVNSEETWIQVLHFVFTIAAIVMGYVSMWAWWVREVSGLNIASTIPALGFTLLGIGGFCLGFFTDVISLAWGEVIVAIPLAIWILITVD